MKSAQNNRDNIYQPGDLVEQWNAVVDSNHCGMPWPVCADGEYIMGAVCIHQTPFGSSLLDAKTGNRLTDDECVLRKGNFAFDYNDRAKLNCGRRYPVPKWHDILSCPLDCIPAVIKAKIHQ